MANYDLPIEAARQRLGRGEPDAERAKRISDENRTRILGRRQTAIALGAVLVSRPYEHDLATRRGFFSGPHAVAAGFVLCERLVFRDHDNARKAHNDLTGLLLTHKGGVYSYRSRLPATLYDTINIIDAWGRDTQTIRRDRTKVECDAIGKLNLDGPLSEVDLGVGAIAAPLTLDDLFAGLAVRYEIAVPGVEMPTTA